MTEHQERNSELYPSVASGNKEAMDAMITENMPFCIYKVQQFVLNCPQAGFLFDDLVSAANLALCEAVRNLAKSGTRENPNVTAYLSTAIQRGIMREANVEMEHKAGKAEIERDDGGEPDPLTKVLSLCENELEVAVIEMRAAGHRDVEIANELNVSASKVGRIRKAVEARYDIAC